MFKVIAFITMIVLSTAAMADTAAKDVAPATAVITTAAPDLVLRCSVDTNPSTTKYIPPADVTLSVDAVSPMVPSVDRTAGLPAVPADDVAKVSLSPSVKQGNGPSEVSVDNLDTPHKALTGPELSVWNQFCRGRNPAEVGQWRYTRCNGLDSAFVK